MYGNEPDLLDTESATDSPRPLVLKFGGSLVEQLGAQLYPSVTATVAELISNAWDADADNVWVSVPFGDDWKSVAELVVLDDGHGMTRAQAQEAYLVVGRKKRLTRLGDRSEGGRPVHGRKGIGKLAAFGTAGYLECTTVRNGDTTSFGIDYDEVRRLLPDQNYYVDNIRDPSPLVAPNGAVLPHGTRVRLTKLRVKRRISPESFRLSMSRRFAIRGMNVFINGEQLQRFDLPLQFRLPRDEAPKDVEVDDDGWGIESLPSGEKVRWWIGFTEKPLVDGDQQGISVLARDKMAQRPFKFERSQGTTAQLGFEYLVGEVEADWLDQGDDIDTDYIQSNRDQLQLENTRLDEFLSWGRMRLTWALRVRGELRAQLLEAEAEENQELDEIMADSSPRERRDLRRVATRLAKIPEMEISEVNSIMRSVVQSRSDAQVRELIEEIGIEPELTETMWDLVSQFGTIDARRLKPVLEARLATISKARQFASTPRAIAELEGVVRQDIWLLDPRWHLLGHSVDARSISGLGTDEPLPKIFVLVPTPPAPLDEVVVVRIGETEPAGRAEFERELEIIRGHFQAKERAPLVRGLLISARAPDEPDGGANPLVRERSWAEVLEESFQMHSGWLALTTRRMSGEL